MTTLVAIDPGAHTGFAVFTDEVAGLWLLGAAYVHSPDGPEGLAVIADVVVIENPQIYPNGKARPADILTLARIVGRYEERYHGAEIHLVTPRQWKGSVDGDIMLKRIEAAMSDEERALTADIRAYAHNAIDAIGLGKWALRQPWMRGRSGRLA